MSNISKLDELNIQAYIDSCSRKASKNSGGVYKIYHQILIEEINSFVERLKGGHKEFAVLYATHNFFYEYGKPIEVRNGDRK